MLSSIALFAAAAIASPFTFPLKDGFPNPNAKNLAIIEEMAGGTLSNAPVPSKVSDDTLTSLRLIAFNEIFEVAFFRELLTNVSSNMAGYEASSIGVDRTYLINTLKSIKNQEEMHALDANGALMHFNQKAIEPCTYQFPVSNLKDAMALANTFTDLVLGVLPAVQADLAAAGDSGLIPHIGSVLAQEGQQVGFFRYAQGRVPSEAPFLTQAQRPFAFTAIQSFIADKSSCAAIKEINLKTFSPMMVMTSPVPAKNTTLQFMTLGSQIKPSTMTVTYLSGINVPVTVPIKDVSCKSEECTFSASFPFGAGFSRGLTVASVTMGSGPFADADAVAEAAMFGPGLMEVDYTNMED